MMNEQAHISGQMSNQAGSQLSGISQQNGSALRAHMQNIRALGNMDPETMVARKIMQERMLIKRCRRGSRQSRHQNRGSGLVVRICNYVGIHVRSENSTHTADPSTNTQLFHRKRPNQTSEWLQRLPDVVRRLEELLFKDAASKEDYLNMETLESRLHTVIKSIPNHNQPLTPHISSSSSFSTMMPTPGMLQSGNTNSVVPCSVDTSMTTTSGSCTVATPGILQSVNGATGIGQSGSFSASDGPLPNGYQQSNISIGSSGKNILSSVGVPHLSSQMIPTPGLNNPQSMLNSECTSGGGFSGVEPTMQQKQKQYGHNSLILQNLGGQIGVNLRSNIQQKPSPYGFPNGVINGGLALIGNNMQLVNAPASSEGYLSAPYGNSLKPPQQQFVQQHHQQIVSRDVYGMSAADLPGSGNLYSPATSVGSVANSHNMNTLNLHHQTNVQSMQQPANIKAPSYDDSQKMNYQSPHSSREHLLQPQRQMHKFQQQQHFQQHSNQQYAHFIQHQQEQKQQTQQHQELMLKSDAMRQSSLTSSAGGELMPEHGMKAHSESLLSEASEQFQLPALHGQYQQNITAEDHSKGAHMLGHLSGHQDFQSFSQSTQQMHQMLHSQQQAAESQNGFSCLSTGSQAEALLQGQGQWHQQPPQKSHAHDQSSFEQHIQEEFHNRIASQDEAQRPQFSLEGSIIGQAAADKSIAVPQSSSGVACGLGNSLRQQQYFNQRKLLLFLRHAQWCSAPEGKCQETCTRTKKLLMHVERCNDNHCMQHCCHITKGLIEHYSTCRAADCPVCVPVHSYMASRRKVHTHPPSDSCSTNPLSGSWKDRNTAVADRAVLKTSASVVNSNEGLPPSLKRVKVDHYSSLTPKNESSPVPVPSINQPHASQVVQPPGSHLTNTSMTSKVEVVEVKTEQSLCSGLKNDPNSSNVTIDYSEDIHALRSDVELAVPNVLDGHAKQDIMEEKKINQAKLENQKEVNAQPADCVGISKSGKPKIKGVSLTELFTPEQIREHIIGLRQWVGQSKAKAERNQAMEHIMSENACQLCAVEKLTFEPPPIYCTPCGARIKRNAMFYTVGTGETRHYFCIPCYNEARGDTIDVEGNTIAKARLEKKKNDEETEEWWVQCDKCEAWQHQICALFNGRRNDGEAEYTCPNCHVKEIESGERKPLPQSAVLGAKDLPRTILSDHIEQRLARSLRQEKQERARHLGKNFDEVPGAEALVVRVVSSVDKKLEVKQRFLEIFQEENYPKEFPYKSKVILLFQMIEGVEVCLFGMYVQEFGSECQFPNQRRVYLSYLDSVKYFRPEIKTVTGEALRTFVYHEILIGYLEYCKKRGFTSCYIWACPPLKGEDYILYCHPEIQKTPKSDKLREWYLAMLRKAAKENIVADLTNLYDHFFTTMGECKAKVTAARLPYFDGDYWPGAAEDMINQLQQEEDGRKQQKKGKTKKTITKRALKAAGQTDLSGNASKDALLMQKLGETICPMKEDFIMVHLQHACTHCCTLMVSGIRWVCNQCKKFQLCEKCHDEEQKHDERDRHPAVNREKNWEKHVFSPVEINDVTSDTKDKDEILESEFFDTRQAFLSLCQGNHYQYDTLRRAKHSSMMVLYHLHNPTAPAFVTTCNVCLHDIETGQGWRCEVCPDFDVCNNCYQKDGGVDHPHRLINHPSLAERDAQSKEARQKRVVQLRKMLDLLVHASQCRFPQCQYPNCRKVKGLFRHGINCKTRASGGCVLCKKMWYLLQLHARACKEKECSVPRCKDLKEHLKRLQQQSDSRRRAAVMEMMRQRAAEVAGNSG